MYFLTAILSHYIIFYIQSQSYSTSSTFNLNHIQPVVYSISIICNLLYIHSLQYSIYHSPLNTPQRRANDSPKSLPAWFCPRTTLYDRASRRAAVWLPGNGWPLLLRINERDMKGQQRRYVRLSRGSLEQNCTERTIEKK